MVDNQVTQMKSTVTIRQRSPLTLWQQQSQVKHGVLHRIKDITAELESLQAAMHGALNEPGEAYKNPFYEDADAVRVLNHFKAELDQLRRILWFYIEEATGKSGPDLDQEEKNRRLQRVTELLGALAPKPAASSQAPAQEPGSFFERLNQVIDVHMNDKTLATKSASAKRHKS